MASISRSRVKVRERGRVQIRGPGVRSHRFALRYGGEDPRGQAKLRGQARIPELEVFLTNRHVPIDTKHIERVLRLIPPKENRDVQLDRTRRPFAEFGYLKQGRRGVSICPVALPPARGAGVLQASTA